MSLSLGSKCEAVRSSHGEDGSVWSDVMAGSRGQAEVTWDTSKTVLH